MAAISFQSVAEFQHKQNLIWPNKVLIIFIYFFIFPSFNQKSLIYTRVNIWLYWDYSLIYKWSLAKEGNT